VTKKPLALLIASLLTLTGGVPLALAAPNTAATAAATKQIADIAYTRCTLPNGLTDISEDKALVEATIRNIEKAIGDFDFKKADSMFLPDARWIEDGPPISANDWSGWWQNAKNAGVRIEYKISDVRVEIEGNVAWATLIIKGTFRGDTPDSQALVGTQANPLSERQTTYVETYVMKKQSGTWKLALAHTSKINM
jgi:ketosteroid isomerase-like protein